jgi:hypothetical protein
MRIRGLPFRLIPSESDDEGRSSRFDRRLGPTRLAEDWAGRGISESAGVGGWFGEGFVFGRLGVLGGGGGGFIGEAVFG